MGNIPKPRPMKNVDVIRMGVTIKEWKDLELAFKTLKSRYRILRVKNNHNPTDGQGFGGYRNLLVNFAFEADLTYADVFGNTGYFDDSVPGSLSEIHLAKDPVGQSWIDYAMTLPQQSEWLWSLQSLWRIARREPHRKIVIGAEVQFIMEPYMRGRALSHLLYKISRCETGPDEMARDFSTGEFKHKSAEEVAKLRAVEGLAAKARTKLRSK